MSAKMKESSKSKPSGEEQVLEFLAKLEHPLKSEIEEIRSIILNAYENITEHIKWNAPSFCIQEQDRITFNLHGKAGIRLVFHCGAKGSSTTGEGPLIQDDTKLLVWLAADRAIVTFASMDDVHSKRDQLTKVIVKWIEATTP